MDTEVLCCSPHPSSKKKEKKRREWGGGLQSFCVVRCGAWRSLVGIYRCKCINPFIIGMQTDDRLASKP